jgi:hypothetical protein
MAVVAAAGADDGMRERRPGLWRKRMSGQQAGEPACRRWQLSLAGLRGQGNAPAVSMKHANDSWWPKVPGTRGIHSCPSPNALQRIVSRAASDGTGLGRRPVVGTSAGPGSFYDYRCRTATAFGRVARWSVGHGGASAARSCSIAARCERAGYGQLMIPSPRANPSTARGFLRRASRVCLACVSKIFRRMVQITPAGRARRSRMPL